VFASLLRRDEWGFFRELFRASHRLAAAWWVLLILRGALPAVFAVGLGQLVGAVQAGRSTAGPLAATGCAFLFLQALAPFQAQVSSNLGDRLTERLNARLLAAAVLPSGLGHLESPQLADNLALARDFELGLTGPELPLAMTFITGSLAELVSGVGQAAVLWAYSWWAPLLVGGGWFATQLLLRKSTVWDKLDGDVLAAQRQAEYSYRLAVDTPAAKEVRLFGIAQWVVGRFTDARRQLMDIRWRETRLPARRVAVAAALVIAANAGFFWPMASDASSGATTLASAITFAQAAIGASALAFGGMSWALPHAVQAVATVERLEPGLLQAGVISGGTEPADGRPQQTLRFRDVSFRYSAEEPPVLDGFDLEVPAGSSLAIVGYNGAGKTTVAKLLCRLYDPTAGRIEADGVDLRRLSVDSWRSQMATVFQDFVRYDVTLRENVAPKGGSEDDILAALRDAGAEETAGLDTVLAAGYEGGVDLSGGQWQRVALARVLYAVRTGARVVVLDEPTAQLDARGESEIFERLLAATRRAGCTTVLISHRFATVRHADQICVIEDGRVLELGSHDTLMAAGGRYRHMFDLQASRFGEEASDDEVLA
jgi:ABC-type multidrug transport system fused ATPase/permease subunit